MSADKTLQDALTVDDMFGGPIMENAFQSSIINNCMVQKKCFSKNKTSFKATRSWERIIREDYNTKLLADVDTCMSSRFVEDAKCYSVSLNIR